MYILLQFFKKQQGNSLAAQWSGRGPFTGHWQELGLVPVRELASHKLSGQKKKPQKTAQHILMCPLKKGRAPLQTGQIL